MSNLIIYDCDIDKYLSEKEIRLSYLKEELWNIMDNIDDYLSGDLNIEHQTECIKTAIQCTDIKHIVKNLNKLFGYNIKVYEETKM